MRAVKSPFTKHVIALLRCNRSWNTKAEALMILRRNNCQKAVAAIELMTEEEFEDFRVSKVDIVQRTGR